MIIKKKTKRKIIGGAVAGVLAVSMLISGLFATPQELTEQNLSPTPVIVEVVQDNVDLDCEDSTAPEEEKRKSFADRLKDRILSLPISVRIALGLPAWVIGWAATALFSWLATLIAAPVAGSIVSWLGLALAALATIAAVTKLIFPDIPLRKILRPRNILTVLIAMGILTASKAIVPLFWDEYLQWEQIFESVFFLAVSLLLVLVTCRIHKKNKIA